MEKLIHLESAAVSMNGRRILDSIDISIGPRESVGVVGPNGSGKTTLMRLLATLIRPSAGKANLLGADLARPVDRDVRRQIGLISHIPGLLEELTISENLAHFARIAGRQPEACHRALAAVGLDLAGGRAVSNASFGMKRRAEIAWLLVSKPKILLLDEARSGLDRDARALVDTLIGLTIERDGAVVSVSHEESAAGSGFSSVWQLENGVLVSTK